MSVVNGNVAFSRNIGPCSRRQKMVYQKETSDRPTKQEETRKYQSVFVSGQAKKTFQNVFVLDADCEKPS